MILLHFLSPTAFLSLFFPFDAHYASRHDEVGGAVQLEFVRSLLLTFISFDVPWNSGYTWGIFLPPELPFICSTTKTTLDAAPERKISDDESNSISSSSHQLFFFVLCTKEKKASQSIIFNQIPTRKLLKLIFPWMRFARLGNLLLSDWFFLSLLHFRLFIALALATQRDSNRQSDVAANGFETLPNNQFPNGW